MMYFIAWCVFLLVVVLAVPIASMMENRARRAAMGPAPESMSDEPVEGEAEEEPEFGEGEEPVAAEEEAVAFEEPQ